MNCTKRSEHNIICRGRYRRFGYMVETNRRASARPIVLFSFMFYVLRSGMIGWSYILHSAKYQLIVGFESPFAYAGIYRPSIEELSRTTIDPRKWSIPFAQPYTSLQSRLYTVIQSRICTANLMSSSVNFLKFSIVPLKLLDAGAEAAHILSSHGDNTLNISWQKVMKGWRCSRDHKDNNHSKCPNLRKLISLWLAEVNQVR